jgi:hypothetical protein
LSVTGSYLVAAAGDAPKNRHNRRQWREGAP